MNELRDALESIVQCVSACNSAEEAVEHLVWISDKATEALDAPSEMQQLVEWLEEQLELVTTLSEIYPISRRYPNRAELYEDVLKHIRAEFLGEEK